MNERVNPSVARPVVSQREGITVRRVGVNLGAEISGVDLRQPLLDAQFAAIEAALVENELIIFRDQNITSDQLMAFGRRFGELTVHPFAPNEGKNAPELIKFRNDETTPPFGTDVWHSDETFRAEPPMATILRATDELPALGGDTMFASMYAAYDALSPRMKTYLEGLTATHDGTRVFGAGTPISVHPVIIQHPVSRKKVIFVNTDFTAKINELPRLEGDRVLQYLIDHCNKPEWTCRFRWEPHSIALWDNRCTHHKAIWDYWPNVRSGFRVQIEGTERPIAA